MIYKMTWKIMIRSLPNVHTTILDLHSDLESPSGVFISARSDCVGSLSTSCSTEWPLCPSTLSAESWHHDSLIRQTCKAWCKIMNCATTLGMSVEIWNTDCLKQNAFSSSLAQHFKNVQPENSSCERILPNLVLTATTRAEQMLAIFLLQ